MFELTWVESELMPHGTNMQKKPALYLTLLLPMLTNKIGKLRGLCEPYSIWHVLC